jgi:hypothetical protein
MTTLTRPELDSLFEASQLIEKEMLNPAFQSGKNIALPIDAVLAGAKIDSEIKEALKLVYNSASLAGQLAAHSMATHLSDLLLAALQEEGRDPVEFVKRALARKKVYYKDPGPEEESI